MAFSPARAHSSRRLYSLAGILLLWCAGICLRLIYLQVFRYGTFEQRAQHQQQRTEEVSPRRGIIYDRRGRELAMSINVDSVFAVPAEMPSPATTISLVARITRQDPRELLARCEATRSFCWITRKPDPEISARIRALKLRGVYFQKESKRYYPKSELAAQVLGYVGMDDVGLSGIERAYEDQLHGRPGRMLISVDARKKWFGSVEKQPEPGRNVVLTIDEKIQYIAERELEAAIRETHAISGTVLVENPRTGEILALANRPTFNPNVARDITPEKLKNHAVSDVYEPGSTFKLVTISGALEERLTRPDEVFDCQMGSIVYNGMRIRDSKAHGLLSVANILAESSDVGSIKIGLRLGDERFYKYIRAFGFGQQTGIELPGETRGMTKPVSRWSRVSIAAISMGQEIGITPLQLAALVSTMANDGLYVAPRIVARTTQPESAPAAIAFHPAGEHRAISPLTAAEMRQMMQGVVLHGTGKKALLMGYSAAGKTGTAQKVDPATHVYSRTKYVASFAGFAPVNDPRITVVVVLDSAVGPHQGGQVSAPVFNRVAQQVLEYLDTPHDVEIPSGRALLARLQPNEKDLEEGSPDHPGEAIDVSTATISDPAAGPATGEPGSTAQAGNVVVAASLRQVEARSAQRLGSNPTAVGREAPSRTGTVVVEEEQGGIVVPSFMGKSVRSAIELAQSSGLDLDVAGSGSAVEQSLAPGSRVRPGTRVAVRFGR
ncbi:MAG: transpeptidase family protein [Acidobacteria bacterium]|nr:transpeptidase family protein [Acidobacteriota bacterium]